jgi:hypothetical protein
MVLTYIENTLELASAEWKQGIYSIVTTLLRHYVTKCRGLI